MVQQNDGRPEDYNEEIQFASLDEDNQEEVSTEEEASEQEAEEQVDDGIPEKYRDKEIKDIVAMHQNAEKLLGKQSQEVGELRKVVDDFIQSQTVAQQQAQEESVDDIDFFEDPKKAVSQLLESHPSLQQSKKMMAQITKQEALSTLKAAHPDYQKIVADDKFKEWVTSSKIRTELLRRADLEYDFESANELLSLWKERQSIVKDAEKNERISRKRAVRSAATGSVKGSTERPSRKIYKRSDIVELMTKDPVRYQAMAAEIRQAYSEGRVK
jgi:hypothetical protein